MTETKLTEDQIEELALKSLENFGEPQDLYHPNAGWILRKGKITQTGWGVISRGLDSDLFHRNYVQTLIYIAGGVALATLLLGVMIGVSL